MQNPSASNNSRSVNNDLNEKGRFIRPFLFLRFNFAAS
jgi:hypothetical protein